ncbi:MAG: hypothetical protein HQL14_01930 [Candidatus Omnitrophica bacterium]|nr:hypothetical protein [Candidatus Omnitrophota bacterium]
MFKIIKLWAPHLLILGMLVVCPMVGRAEQITQLEVSLFHPLQAYPDEYSVDGFRLDLIYGINEDLQGVDLGVVNTIKGNAHGFELGAVNRVHEDFGGWQSGLFNEVGHDFKGFQLGLFANVARGSCTGVQAAILFNDTEEDLRGIQFGIINTTGSLYGVQIGFFNFNDDDKYLGFFPFIHAAF